MNLLVTQPYPFFALILVSIIPFYFFNKWLKKRILGSGSGWSIFLYFLVVLSSLFLYTILITWITMSLLWKNH